MNKYLSSLFILVVLVSVSGCNTFNVKPDYIRSVGETDASTELKAYVGDILYSKYDYSSRDYTRVTTVIRMGMLPINQVGLTDAVMLRSTLDGKPAACGQAQRGAYTMALCLLDNNNDNSFDSFKFANGEEGSLLKRGNSPIPYSYRTSDEVDGIKKEIIYQGREGDTLRFRYREYIKDIVRPAYDQTVEYNLSEDNIVTFRGMRILVEEATNQDIVYRIISGTIDL